MHFKMKYPYLGPYAVHNNTILNFISILFILLGMAELI